MAKFILLMAVLLVLAAFASVVLALCWALTRARRELDREKTVSAAAENGLRDVLGDHPEFAHNHVRVALEKIGQARLGRATNGRHSAA